MTAIQPECWDHDLEPLSTVERRFALEIFENDLGPSVVAMSMPVTGLTNPFTAAPTLGPLAILVDAAAGRTNHVRRGAGEWSLSSELSLELSPGAALGLADDAGDRVIATARALGRKDLTSVSLCTLTTGTETIGCATVRSYFISANRVVDDHIDSSPPATMASLAELLAVRIPPADDGTSKLIQQPNPAINNAIGVVHGGVATAGLELAASAAMDSDGAAMATASIRVNFLRPFVAGGQSRYVAEPLRIGRTSASADAQAIGDDGKVAIVARVTAYR